MNDLGAGLTTWPPLGVTRVQPSPSALPFAEPPWFLYVGDRDFRMPIRPHHISDEIPHRVYVPPKAKRIIAIEPDL